MTCCAVLKGGLNTAQRIVPIHTDVCGCSTRRKQQSLLVCQTTGLCYGILSNVSWHSGGGRAPKKGIMEFDCDWHTASPINLEASEYILVGQMETKPLNPKQLKSSGRADCALLTSRLVLAAHLSFREH